LIYIPGSIGSTLAGRGAMVVMGSTFTTAIDNASTSQSRKTTTKVSVIDSRDQQVQKLLSEKNP